MEHYCPVCGDYYDEDALRACGLCRQRFCQSCMSDNCCSDCNPFAIDNDELFEEDFAYLDK